MKLEKAFIFCIVICGVFCQAQSEGQQCGKKPLDKSAVALSFGGTNTEKNAWPWLVAFVNKSNDDYFCSGSLISTKHVVAAAHCFQNKREDTVKSPQNITALVGKRNLSIAEEPGSTEHSVQQIILHPNWNSQDIRFDADISVVVLRDFVMFNENVQLICLPQPSEAEVSGTGSVVGWSKIKDSNKTRSELEVSALDLANCLLTFPDLTIVASNRTFCVGFVGQSKAPCTSVADIEGGFYSRDSTTELFELKGIFSVSIADKKSDCDSQSHSVYTNVALFLDWIQKELKETKQYE